MHKPSQLRRQLTTRDLMILIVATAAGFSLTRWLDSQRLPMLPPIYVDGILDFVTPMTATWSVALVFLDWRSPKPRRLRLFRLPGFVACAAASAALALELTLVMPMFALGILRFTGPDFRLAAYGQLVPPIGAAVVVSWIIEVLSGRWKPEPVWTDRVGRIIGVCWIAIFIISHIVGLRISLRPLVAPPPMLLPGN